MKQSNQKKIAIDLNIRSATIAVTEPMDIVILWKRGAKKIDTKIKSITPENTTAIFNEQFQMKTQLEWDSLRNQFRKKQSILSVHLVRAGEDVMEAADNNTSIVLGDANFDLAYYANNPEINQDKLPLKKCKLDEEAFIQIHIKTNSNEVLMKSQP